MRTYNPLRYDRNLLPLSLSLSLSLSLPLFYVLGAFSASLV